MCALVRAQISVCVCNDHTRLSSVFLQSVHLLLHNDPYWQICSSTNIASLLVHCICRFEAKNKLESAYFQKKKVCFYQFFIQIFWRETHAIMPHGTVDTLQLPTGRMYCHIAAHYP